MRIFKLATFGIAVLLGAGCSSFKVAPSDAAIIDQPASIDQTQLSEGFLGESTDQSRGNQLIPDQIYDPVPLDFVCTEPWTLEVKSESGCDSRTVRFISAQAMDLTNLAIAVSATGRTGIMFNSKAFADEGTLYVAALTGPDLEIQEFTGYAFEIVGPVGAIAADDSGAFHLAYLIVGDGGHSIAYQQYLPSGVVTGVEPVVSGFSSRAHLAIGVGSTLEAYVVYYNATLGEVKSKIRSSTGDWSNELVIDGSLEPLSMFAGEMDLVMDQNRVPHLAYVDSSSVSHAMPKYGYIEGTTWNGPTTLDNAAPSGNFGFSIGLALHGNQRYATYLAITAQDVEFRLAQWSLVSPQPSITVLDTLSILDHDSPAFSSALAMDRHGLLHLAVVNPLTSNEGRLEYWRQYPVAGEKVWYKDVIDSNVQGFGARPLVDLVLDGQDRPHIAYYSAAQGKVFYATRSDR